MKATLAGYFFLSGSVILLFQAHSGLFTREVILYGLISTPGVFLGVLAGLWCYRRLDTANYRHLIVVLITLLGCLTVIKAVL